MLDDVDIEVEFNVNMHPEVNRQKIGKWLIVLTFADSQKSKKYTVIVYYLFWFYQCSCLQLFGLSWPTEGRTSFKPHAEIVQGVQEDQSGTMAGQEVFYWLINFNPHNLYTDTEVITVISRGMLEEKCFSFVFMQMCKSITLLLTYL